MSEYVRPPLNGAELHLALPQLSANGIVGYIIVVKTTGGWCLTWVTTLADTYWGSGTYFPLTNKGMECAFASAYIRAGMHHLNWKQVEADLEGNPNHF